MITNIAARLAASIALAMCSVMAWAATAPAATQLPGKGTLSGSGTVTVGAISNGAQNIDVSGNAVINWGTGSGINPGNPGGFDIGSSAGLTFSGGTGSAVLNIDSSGNASQILGGLSANGTNVFVANANGIIVGATARIFGSGSLGLVGNALGPSAASDFASHPTNLSYIGTGGDVTVQPGATIANSVLVSGGDSVNVNLNAFTGGSVNLAAGVPSVNAAPGTSNPNAALNTTGQLAGGNLAGFSSAGTASNAGILNLDGTRYSVAGLFTNSGSLTLPVTNGAVRNQNMLTTAAETTFSSLANEGAFAAGGGVYVVGGNLINSGTLSGAGYIWVKNGAVRNTGTLSDLYLLETSSDANNTLGVDCSITNAGLIIAKGDSGAGNELTINANGPRRGNVNGTGSFTNSGTLRLSDYTSYPQLYIDSGNDITLAGTLEVGDQALSTINQLGFLNLYAANGTVTLATPVNFLNEADINGSKVRLMANLTSDAMNVNSRLYVAAGDKLANDYAIRVGGGASVSAAYVYVEGSQSTDHPNVILQGTVGGAYIQFGGDDNGGLNGAVSDVFSGPDGGVLASNAGLFGAIPNPYVEFDFTGRIKNAPYLNDSNFRYNYLPISVTGDTGLTLTLKPAAYLTNGTSNGLSVVNLLVNGNVTINATEVTAQVGPNGIAVTGAVNIPNTHIVLQSAGSISTAGDFNWPGYVYFGTIGMQPGGAAAPGTLGIGAIVLGGNFNNVLPGSVDFSGGIHFITQLALRMNGHTVTTNANSLLNFGTDALTRAYAMGKQGNGLFFAGTRASGGVVNYGALDPSLFATQVPVSKK